MMQAVTAGDTSHRRTTMQNILASVGFFTWDSEELTEKGSG